METAKKGDKVKVHYSGRLTDGTTFDSSEGRAPLEFEIGSGQVIPGFDTGVTGLQTGEKRTVTIPAEQAYGAVSEDHIIEYPKAQFPPDLNIEVGMPLQMSNEYGQSFQVVVKEIKDDTVILDANHPLAGKDLVFDIELVEIVR
jgi:peptidylprolyl isomerase